MTRCVLAQIRVAVDPEAAQERKGDSAEPVRLEIELPDTYPDVVPKIVGEASAVEPSVRACACERARRARERTRNELCPCPAALFCWGCRAVGQTSPGPCC